MRDVRIDDQRLGALPIRERELEARHHFEQQTRHAVRAVVDQEVATVSDTFVALQVQVTERVAAIVRR